MILFTLSCEHCQNMSMQQLCGWGYCIQCDREYNTLNTIAAVAADIYFSTQLSGGLRKLALVTTNVPTLILFITDLMHHYVTQIQFNLDQIRGQTLPTVLYIKAKSCLIKRLLSCTSERLQDWCQRTWRALLSHKLKAHQLIGTVDVRTSRDIKRKFAKRIHVHVRAALFSVLLLTIKDKGNKSYYINLRFNAAPAVVPIVYCKLNVLYCYQNGVNGCLILWTTWLNAKKKMLNAALI